MSFRSEPWVFLKNQLDKLAIVASLLTLGVSVVKSLLDKANPPLLSLTIFSILVAGMGIWMIFARKPAPDPAEAGHAALSRQFSIRKIVEAWIAGALLLALAWGFVYRERILYSGLMAGILGGRRVVVSDGVAWEVLRSETLAGVTKSNTVAGEIASVLSGLPYRVVVMSRKDLARYTPTERDGFLVEGMAESVGVVLRTQMILTQERVDPLIKQLTADMKVVRENQEQDVPALLMPVKRFLRNQFLFAKFSTSVPLTDQTPERVRMTVATLNLRFALATMFFYDGSTEAARLFREIVSFGKALPSMKSEPLARIYKAASYYLATQQQDIGGALSAIELASAFNPSDAENTVIQTYLLLASGQKGQAGELLKKLQPSADDPAQFHELKGEFFQASQRFQEAIEAYEAALRLEEDDFYKFFLHLGIALSYGRDSRAKDRAAAMIRHLEDASELRPDDATSLILQGFAWALQGDAVKSREAFDSAKSRINNEGGDKAKSRLLVYWLGRSLYELRQYPQAIEELGKVVTDLEKSQDADLLFILGQNLLNIEGRAGDAEKYLDRAIQIDPSRGKPYRYKGLAVAMRWEKTPESAATQRRRLNDEARSNLIKSIKLGDEEATTHAVLAELYKAAGDSVNAEKHRRRQCEFDPENSDCLIRTAVEQIKSRNYSAARDTFAKARKAEPRDADVLLQEGIAWQQAGENKEAEAAYVAALRLDPNSFAAHDNVGFVLFELGRFQEALSHFGRAAKLKSQEPDAQAGQAIALEAMGKHSEAMVAYRLAVQVDKRYLDCGTLQKEFLWSKKACKTAAPLIEQISRQ